MKWIGIWTVVYGASLALTVASSGAPEPTTDRYKTILAGNPFRLKPPVVEVPKAEPPPPADTIFLTGIATILPPSKALIARQEPGAKTTDYLTLAVGEKDGSIEVLEIDEQNGLVKIANGGVPRVLSFDTDSMKAVSAPTGVPGAPPGSPGYIPPGAPGAPGNPGFQPGRPGQPTAGFTPPTYNNPRPGTATPGGSGVITAPYTVPAATTPTDNGMRTIPSRVPRIPINTAPQSNSVVPQTAPVDPVVQTVQMEVSRQVSPPGFPPLPPTDLTPQSDQ